METTKDMIAWYRFEDEENVGKDSSGNGRDAVAHGAMPPVVREVNGRKALSLRGKGINQNSYLELPANILSEVSDDEGMCISFWVSLGKGRNVWERILDFGKSNMGPYLFLTRNLRAVCFPGADLAADPGQIFPEHSWFHVAVDIFGTKNGTESSAGPVVYVDGELLGDGLISQTSSGDYKLLREWFAGLKEEGNYIHNYIGRSQFDADPDIKAALADFRIYKRALSESEIVDIVCETISDRNIIDIVLDKYLEPPAKLIEEDVDLPREFMGGKVKVSWSSEKEEVLSSEGKLGDFEKPEYLRLTATLTAGEETVSVDYYVNAIPQTVAPCTLTIHADKEGAPISDTLYGLFYEDINNAADGGLYAEMVSNRSFEDFTYRTFDVFSGVDGRSTGRNHTPLKFWFGDLDKVTPKNTGGLNEHLGITEPDTNEYYVTVSDGAVLYNRGFCDTNEMLSMYLKQGERYDFSVWAKAENGPAEITAELVDESGYNLSNSVKIPVTGKEWMKYGREQLLVMEAAVTGYAQLKLSFKGEVSIDMVSLMPESVWGAGEEKYSATAHANYLGNSNYRLRRDMVEAMRELHPTFLRFPGGCISEGSYIWENVYDWKDSVDDIEYRKENYNVWGYMMTMGLGYMEYFQLAEDLNALPLPVMACGVLCQARSDYANPAGGSLQEKYIKNFIDLIDFAISTDFDGNEWAALRKKMGHEEPFKLHLLGVGNENWGEEFFASFEEFKYAIDRHMEETYPGYDLTIISTVGAQADDDAYRYGWRYLSGNLKTGGATVSFTDGEHSFDKEVKWYQHEDNFMETIADEHYYRPNQYLYENVDRYNYYYRAYKEDGTMDEAETSKVFVGEYASTEKNTLAGAVAEAALMTGFERNSDVVRLAATAPLFNKVLTDGQYRWTPDAIWFDNEAVWRTPNYYVQQMFAGYLGKTNVETTFTTYARGRQVVLTPYGGIELAASSSADILLKEVTVTSNADGSVLLYQDFKEELKDGWQILPDADGPIKAEGGLLLKAMPEGMNGIYMLNDHWSDYTVQLKAERVNGTGGLFVGVGLADVAESEKNVIEYAVSMHGNQTGIRVFKNGLESYSLGDYSSSELAGNLRACNYEPLEDHKEYTFTVNYGGGDGKKLSCYFEDGDGKKSIQLDYKLEAYNRIVFHSVTRDEKHLYAKLVNSGNVDKKLEIILDGFKNVGSAHIIVLTAEDELVNEANVNTKGNERVKPMEYRLAVNNQKAQIFLPANSVTVMVF